MLRKILRYSVFTSFFLLTSLFVQGKLTTPVKSATTHVVISEIQVEGTLAKDEFVELYNPTNTNIDLTGWKLKKKISTGTESNLVTSIEGTIPSYGFFLLAHPDDYSYNQTPNNDYSSSSYSITDNNTVILYDNLNNVIDKVGLGTASDYETSSISQPTASSSIERKAQSSSTQDSMKPGGEDELNGNGQDSDNNSADFIQRLTPNPQNSSSPPESPVTASPTPEPISTPTPEAIPTPISTIEPSPTSSPLPTPKTIGSFTFPSHVTTCTVNYRLVKIRFFQTFFPYVTCTRSQN